MKRLLPLLLAVFLSLAAQGADASVTVFAGVDHFGVPRAAYLSEDRALLSFLSFAD